MLVNQVLPITIRPAYAEDEPALRRLAALDSALVPGGRVLVAEVDGEIRVAVSADDLAAVADPFHLTSDLVELVRDHIARSRARAERHPRRQPGKLALVVSLL
jgi:hypothetical protein